MINNNKQDLHLQIYPGFATKDEAYYSYEGQDYSSNDFSWVVSENNTYLVHNNHNTNPPSNALMIAYQQHAYPYYFILGYNKNHGMIPGFFNGSKAVYAYGGKEFTAKDFYWIVVDNPGRFGGCISFHFLLHIY